MFHELLDSLSCTNQHLRQRSRETNRDVATCTICFLIRQSTPLLSPLTGAGVCGCLRAVGARKLAVLKYVGALDRHQTAIALRHIKGCAVRRIVFWSSCSLDAPFAAA